MPRGKGECIAHASVFPVTDIKRALDYYTKSLGFDVDFEWADPETNEIGYATLSKEAVMVHLSASDRQFPGLMYVFVDSGIDALYREMGRKKAAISAPLEEQPWGMREFEVVDDDGNRIIFGHSIKE